MIRTLPYDLIMYFLNHIVLHIPFWQMRKAIFKILGMKIGKKSRILMGTIVYNPWMITIGDNVVINEECILDGRGGITICNNVSISMRTVILTGTHDVNSDCFAYKSNAVVIKDNVWTGVGSIILPGAVLEERVVLAAGSVAKAGSYDKNWVYSGVPAQKIKKRKINENYLLGNWQPWLR